MNDNIRIKIHMEYSALNGIIFSLALLVSVALTVYLRSFKAEWLIITSALGAALVIAVSCAQEPTAVWTDDTRLHWKFRRSKHSIRLDDITDLSIEPYQIRVRGGYRQRIRLTLRTRSHEMPEIEFSDEVDANAVLNEKIDGNHTDLPLMQLYDHLCERGIGI